MNSSLEKIGVLAKRSQDRQNTPKLIFLGAGGIAIVAAEIARLRGFEIVGFLDEKSEKHGTVFCGARILGDFSMLPALRREGLEHVIIAFGSCQGRIKVAQKALSCDFSFPSLIHPSAIVSPDVGLGCGAILMPGAIINAGSRIGANIIVNTAASIDHECTIGDGVHIGPGSRLCGLVTVGTGTWIGVGTVIRESVTIGSDVLVGAGSLVLKDIPDGVVAYGSPARIIGPNS